MVVFNVVDTEKHIQWNLSCTKPNRVLKLYFYEPPQECQTLSKAVYNANPYQKSPSLCAPYHHLNDIPIQDSVGLCLLNFDQVPILHLGPVRL